MHHKDVALLETRLLQLRDMAGDEARITASTRRISETNAIRAARRNEHHRKKGAMIESIMEVVTLCASHREGVQSQLEAVKERYSRRLESFLVAGEGLNADAYRTISKQILCAPSGDIDSVSLRRHLGSGSRGSSSSGGHSSTHAFAKNDYSVTESKIYQSYGDANGTPVVANDDSFMVGSDTTGSNNKNDRRQQEVHEVDFSAAGGDMCSPITSYNHNPTFRNVVHSGVSET